MLENEFQLIKKISFDHFAENYKASKTGSQDYYLIKKIKMNKYNYG